MSVDFTKVKAKATEKFLETQHILVADGNFRVNVSKQYVIQRS